MIAIYQTRRMRQSRFLRKILPSVGGGDFFQNPKGLTFTAESVA